MAYLNCYFLFVFDLRTRRAVFTDGCDILLLSPSSSPLLSFVSLLGTLHIPPRLWFTVLLMSMRVNVFCCTLTVSGYEILRDEISLKGISLSTSKRGNRVATSPDYVYAWRFFPPMGSPQSLPAYFPVFHA